MLFPSALSFQGACELKFKDVHTPLQTGLHTELIHPPGKPPSGEVCVTGRVQPVRGVCRVFPKSNPLKCINYTVDMLC